jgi:hypothetical protein
MVESDELIVTSDMVDMACMDPADAGSGEIMRLIGKLEIDIENIRGQIDYAARKFRNEGVKSSDEWFRNAQKALRIKQGQKERLQRALIDARFIERTPVMSMAAASNERFDIRIAFYNAARDILHEDDFSEILTEAQGRIAKQEAITT